MKILLCGFTGAGKSTLLKQLQGKNEGFAFKDLDHVIAQWVGCSPDKLGNWIEENGFTVFRDCERTKLRELLKQPEPMVIALGGGTLRESLISEIKLVSSCKFVFLDTPFETCLERIKHDSNRPLSKLPHEELKKLYESRRMIYQSLAHLTLTLEQVKEIESVSALVHNLN